MKSIDEYLNWFEQSARLPDLIHQSGVLKIPFSQRPWKPGRTKVHTPSSKRAAWLLDSVEGSELRWLLEREMGFRFSRVETGKVKTALILYFVRHHPEED